MLDIRSTVKLNSGYEMPLLGFGVFEVQVGEVCERAVRAALDAGYVHIDTAAIYRNEESVGKALAESGVDREGVFVTTKIFCNSFGREEARQSCEDSLRKLRTDYVDLMLIHWPKREGVKETWETMQALRDAGKLRSIGVSNFTVRRLEEQFFGETDEVPAVNQVELHPFWTRRDLVDYCRGKGIQPEAYSPLARARRMDDPTLNELAAAYGKSVAQVMIRWQLQQGIVVIPKSVHAERIAQNADVFGFELSAEDMARIAALNEDLCTITWRPEEGWF